MVNECCENKQQSKILSLHKKYVVLLLFFYCVVFMLIFCNYIYVYLIFFFVKNSKYKWVVQHNQIEMVRILFIINIKCFYVCHVQFDELIQLNHAEHHSTHDQELWMCTNSFIFFHQIILFNQHSFKHSIKKHFQSFNQQTGSIVQSLNPFKYNR